MSGASTCQDLTTIHKKYGPVVRIGANEVSISAPNAYRDIYNSRNVTRDPRFYKPKAFMDAGNVFSAM